MDGRGRSEPEPRRFRDPGDRLEWLASEVQAVCPRCGQRAWVTARPPGPDGPHPGRVTCDSCGFARDSAGKRTSWGSPHDPWFGLPLWLQAPCCGELLWAFNERHLDLLERFVAATVREKPAIMPGRAGSIISKLPAWVKDAHNREAVLRAIAQLRDRAG